MNFVTFPDDIQKGTPFKLVDGIPYTKIPYTQEYHPHSTNIACYMIRREDPICAEWLLDNMDKDGAIWNNFKLPYYDFQVPWVGGLSQGLTITALIRMYEKTKKKTYLNGAKKAFLGLKKHCMEDLWICEYPRVPTILNGNLYAILGIDDLGKYDKKAKEFSERLITRLCSNLHRFDLGYWSLYDLGKNIPASLFYHKVHIELLYTLYCRTEETILQMYQRRFEDQMQYEVWATLKRLLKIWSVNGSFESYRKWKLVKNWKRSMKDV